MARWDIAKEILHPTRLRALVFVTTVTIPTLWFYLDQFAPPDVYERARLGDHLPSFGAWQWATAVSVAVIGFVLWGAIESVGKRDAQIATLSNEVATLSAIPLPEAPPDHIERLRGTALTLREAVTGDSLLHLDGHQTRSLLAHIPDLGPPLDSWNQAVRATASAHRQFTAWLPTVLDMWGFVHPVTQEAARQNLEQMFHDETLRIAREGFDPDARFTLSGLHVFSAGGFVNPGPPWRVEVATAGFAWEQRFADGLDSEDEAEFWWLCIQFLFNAVLRSQPLADVIQAEQHREAAKRLLMPELDEVADSSAFTRVAPDCGLCPPIGGAT